MSSRKTPIPAITAATAAASKPSKPPKAAKAPKHPNFAKAPTPSVTVVDYRHKKPVECLLKLKSTKRLPKWLKARAAEVKESERDRDWCFMVLGNTGYAFKLSDFEVCLVIDPCDGS